MTQHGPRTNYSCHGCHYLGLSDGELPVSFCHLHKRELPIDLNLKTPDWCGFLNKEPKEEDLRYVIPRCDHTRETSVFKPDEHCTSCHTCYGFAMGIEEIVDAFDTGLTFAEVVAGWRKSLEEASKPKEANDET